MIELTESASHAKQTLDTFALEQAILDNNIEDARNALRALLLQMSSLESGSIGDALQELAREPMKHRAAAIVLLRCIAIQGLLPEPNTANQIIRLTVQLCEGAIPEIVNFLKIDSRSQNIGKFLLLTACHQRVAEILSPLQIPYGDLGALLSARKDILGCLNHSVIRQYGSQFLLKETRSTIESIIGKLGRLSETTPSLLMDIEDCNRAISLAKGEATSTPTFLNQDFLIPFLRNAENVISAFVDTLRGRFSTSITFARTIGSQLQKRYPLHESGRELQIAIPFRNSGPGLATNLEISATSATDDIVLGGSSINLGNVLPGDFSVILDAMVIAATAKFQLMLEVKWGEIGNPVRRTEVFEIEVVAQEAKTDWQSLEYKTPYSTDVARGEHFVGRLDKVRLLATKLLRNPMEPFYITGQKRVGKTSLALAAAEFAKTNNQNAIVEGHYVLWGGVAHADPTISLRRLGDNIENFIQRCLPTEVVVPKGDYNGSLADLVHVANFAFQVSPTRKFVIILDEFDEIHQELFLQGNLAETFFANLRALSRCGNICIVLVGGENPNSNTRLFSVRTSRLTKSFNVECISPSVRLVEVLLAAIFSRFELWLCLKQRAKATRTLIRRKMSGSRSTAGLGTPSCQR
jgi:hypothetical protein